MEIYFQKGKYPIRQIIFVELDSVLGGLVTSVMLKPKYGKIDIIHSLRKHSSESDAVLLMKTTSSVVSTCWSAKRTAAALPEYLKLRGWDKDDVRLYEVGKRIALA